MSDDIRLKLFVFLAFIYGCTSQNREHGTEAQLSDSSGLQPAHFPDTCFAGVDTMKSGQTVGCSGYFAKLISDEYVVEIQLGDTGFTYGNCEPLSVDSSNRERFKLFIFKKGKSHLMNLCGDVVVTNAPKPILELTARAGKLVVGYSDPTDYYGNERPKVTILIKRLDFFDSRTKDIMTIEDELFWKVLDVGMGG